MQNDENPTSPVALASAEQPTMGARVYTPTKRTLWKFLKLALIALIIITIMILILITLATLLPEKSLKNEFSIGSQTITKESILSYRDEMQRYVDTNASVFLGNDENDARSLEEIAIDDLLMNATYKDQAGRCKVKLKAIDEDFGYRFSRVRAENTAWQETLDDCVLVRKKIFSVFITYDTPYFNNLPGGEATAAYQAAKSKLTSEVLPLFKAKKSAETIANYDGRTRLPETELTETEWQATKIDGYGVSAIEKWCYTICFQDIKTENLSKPYPGKLGQAVSTNGELAKLKNVGDFTDVFTGEDGTFRIMRLEAVGDGKYANWDMLLKQAKDHAYNTPPEFVTSIKKFAQWVLDALNPFADVFAACAYGDNHLMDIEIKSVDKNGATMSNGTSKAKMMYYGTCGNNAIGYSGSQVNNANCNDYQPTVSGLTFDTANYDLVSTSVSAKCGISKLDIYSQNSSGFNFKIHWQNEANSCATNTAGADIVITIKLTPKQVTMLYKPGTGATGADFREYKDKGAVEPLLRPYNSNLNFTKSGYKFTHWSVNGGVGNKNAAENVKRDKDYTATAQWEPTTAMCQIPGLESLPASDARCTSFSHTPTADGMATVRATSNGTLFDYKDSVALEHFMRVGTYIEPTKPSTALSTSPPQVTGKTNPTVGTRSNSYSVNAAGGFSAKSGSAGGNTNESTVYGSYSRIPGPDGLGKFTSTITASPSSARSPQLPFYNYSIYSWSNWPDWGTSGCVNSTEATGITTVARGAHTGEVTAQKEVRSCTIGCPDDPKETCPEKRQTRTRSRSEYVSSWGWDVTTTYSGTATSSVTWQVISPWELSASSSGPTTAGSQCLTASNYTKPTCTITFKHSAWNNEWVVKDDNNNWVPITATIQQSNNSGLSWSNVTSKTNSSVNESTYIMSNQSNTATIGQADVGNEVCQRVKVNKTARDNSAELYSEPVCVYVPYNYSTKAENTSGYSPDQIVELGSTHTLTARYSIGNASSSLGSYGTKSKILGWSINVSCTKGGRVINTCPAGYKGFQTITTAGGAFTAAHTITINDDIPLGTHVCFNASISPAAVILDVDQGGTHTSATICLRVGKYPKVQTHGGGVSAADGISTHTTNRINAINSDGTAAANRGVFGSWSEYEALSASNIVGFGSLAAFQKPAADTAPAGYNKMTFGNVSPTGGAAYGDFKSGARSSVADLIVYFYNTAKRMADGVAYSDATILTSSNEESVYNGTDTVTINGGTVPKGHTAIVYTTGDVNITGNIQYADTTYTSIAEIPQVVIISKKNIRIADSVTRVDAWLIAHNESSATAGTIFTCDNADETVAQIINRLKHTVCNQLLTVNGPVYAEKLHMLRTGGAEITSPKDPAEVFNLPSSTYLWAYSYANRKNIGYAITKYSIELPPRY